MVLTVEPAIDLRSTVSEFLAELAADTRWKHALAESAVVVHGSVTTGNADQYSDVDVQAICPDERCAAERASAVAEGRLRAGERSVLLCSQQATLDGRRPLCAAELRSHSEVEAALRTDLLVELWTLQNAWVVRDPGERVTRLVTSASKRFADQLEALTAAELGHAARRQIWLAVAAQRRDAAGAAMLVAGFVRAILRVACLLEGSPVPPDKWLHRWSCSHTALGAAVRTACLHLLCGQVRLNELDEASADTIATARSFAGDRWPRAPWVHAPVNYGTIRC